MTKVHALNTISGVVAVVNESVLTHPVFSQHYVQVDEGTKSFAPDLWKAKTADEYRESQKAKAKATEKPAEPVTPDANQKGQ